jgi:hypothetical protein
MGHRGKQQHKKDSNQQSTKNHKTSLFPSKRIARYSAEDERFLYSPNGGY